ncbi:SRPBCC family protein [Larkinella knui]|nr:SRPBCC domain-containing protein [Larkinella knui]
MFKFSVDKKTHTITIEREFAAECSLVWEAWTRAEILDRWWAPKPWKSETKRMKFEVGGFRHYAMCGPNGEKHWGLTDYKSITYHRDFTGIDYFSDEEANKNESLPVAGFQVRFLAATNLTQVTYTARYSDLVQLENVVKMGAIEGMKSALNELDRLIKLVREGD